MKMWFLDSHSIPTDSSCPRASCLLVRPKDLSQPSDGTMDTRITWHELRVTRKLELMT